MQEELRFSQQQWCHEDSVVEAQSLEHRRGPLSKECHSSEARREFNCEALGCNELASAYPRMTLPVRRPVHVRPRQLYHVHYAFVRTLDCDHCGTYINHTNKQNLKACKKFLSGVVK